jgi:TP901 family phage tail tape measure protein
VAVNFDAVLRLVAKVDGLQEIDKLKGAIGGVEGIAKDARKAFTNVTSSATWQAAAVGAAAIGAGLVSSVQVAMDFEKSMSAVAAKTQAGQEDMAKLTELAKDLGRSTQFSAKEVADGMDFLAMAGFKVNDVLTAMPGLLDLAAAGNLDLASAADIVSNILGGMNMEAAETGRVSDVLAKAATSSNVSVGMLGETFKFVAPVAAQAGVGLEDVAAAAGLLGDAGIQGSEAGTALRSVLLRLAAPPTEAAKALERLGVSTKDASGNMRPFGEILADVDHSMKDLNLGSAEQIEIQNALFGKTAIASGAILQQAAANGELSAKTKELMESQGAAAEMAEIMNDNLAGAFKRLQSAIEGFQIQLVSGTNPAVQVFVDGAAAAINVVTDMMERFPILTGAVVALAAAFVALVALAPFIAAFISVIGSIKLALTGVGFATIVAGWQTAAIVAFGAIQTAIAGFLTWVGATFIPALLAFFSGPVGWTVLAIAAVIAMAIAFREPIMEFFTWLGGAIADGLEALWQWGEPIREFWAGVWEGIKDFATGYFTWLAGTVSWGLEAVFAIVYQLLVQPWVNLWENILREPVTSMLAWLENIWNGVSQAFVDRVAKPIGDAWNAVIEALPKAMQAAAEFVEGVWTGLVESVKGVVRDMLQFIADAINNVAEMVNSLIASFNALPGPNIPFVPTFSVPAFAQGGVVNRKTLAMVGEGGEREYIVPESKMAAASSRFLGGARGADVIPSGSGGGAPAQGQQTPVINITTGPVMEFDGRRFATIEDLQSAARQTATQIYATLRTPAGRRAIGVA